jgi:hypothetical protein
MPGSPNFRMTFKRGCAQEPETGSASDTRFLAAHEIDLSQQRGEGEPVATPRPTATSTRWGEVGSRSDPGEGDQGFEKKRSLTKDSESN